MSAHQYVQIDVRNFGINNAAKEFRDKTINLYDEFICTKINREMTVYDADQATKRFLRKMASHALNSLQENKEEFVNKYMQRYNEKVAENARIRAERQRLLD